MRLKNIGTVSLKRAALGSLLATTAGRRSARYEFCFYGLAVQTRLRTLTASSSA